MLKQGQHTWAGFMQQLQEMLIFFSDMKGLESSVKAT